MSANDTSGTAGTGLLRSGQHNLGATHYEIHVGIPNRPGTVVELESPPNAQDGEVLDLALEDGRILQIHVRGVSPYCRVIGERPAHDRRFSSVRLQPDQHDPARRRADARGPAAIHHPCPRCTGTEVLITHRGVMLTTLFCTVCHHGWGEAPSVVASATRTDRRNVQRPDSSDRRTVVDRLATPVCEYCATDTHVRSTRRTPHEVYFVCLACDAMWALARPGVSRQSPVDSR